MYFDSETIYEALKCSFCAVRFTDKIKLIPDCGSSICQDCYSGLNEDLDDSGKFKCKACREWHPMPPNGMPDDKRLMNLLKQKPQEKSLSAKAQTLKTLIEETQDRVCMLEATDGQEEINKHCDQLETDVREVMESAKKHISQIESDMLDKISSYRQRLLIAKASTESSDKASEPESSHGEFKRISREIEEFSAKWLDYFNRIDKAASDDEISTALDKQQAYSDKLNQLEKQMKSELFQGKLLAFRVNSVFFKSTKHVGELAEIKLQVDQTADVCSPKPDASNLAPLQVPENTKSNQSGSFVSNDPNFQSTSQASELPKTQAPECPPHSKKQMKHSKQSKQNDFQKHNYRVKNRAMQGDASMSCMPNMANMPSMVNMPNPLLGFGMQGDSKMNIMVNPAQVFPFIQPSQFNMPGAVGPEGFANQENRKKHGNFGHGQNKQVGQNQQEQPNQRLKYGQNEQRAFHHQRQNQNPNQAYNAMRADGEGRNTNGAKKEDDDPLGLLGTMLKAAMKNIPK